jgi:hypothetical protein
MDVGKPTYRMNIIQRAFAAAYQMLMVYVAAPYEPTVSILASILPPTEEMSERARMLQSTNGKGALDDNTRDEPSAKRARR